MNNVLHSLGVFPVLDDHTFSFPSPCDPNFCLALTGQSNLLKPHGIHGWMKRVFQLVVNFLRALLEHKKQRKAGNHRAIGVKGCVLRSVERASYCML